MNYSFQKAENSTVKITINFTSEEFEVAQGKAYNKTKSRYAIQGFRKGHAPRAVIEKTYGKGVFFEEAINLAFNENYFEILDKEPTIDPIDRPEIGVESIDENGLVLTATVTVKPEVKIDTYKGINIPKVEYTFNEAELDAQIERFLDTNASEVEVTDRSVVEGDITTIDYSGAIDGVKFEGGTAEKQNLTIGSKMFIPGFEDQVIGMNIGETKDITVTFPENYGASDLSGKDAIFTVTLHAIKAKVKAELTDELVKEKAGAESVEAYKTKLTEDITKAGEQKAERDQEDAIIKAVVDRAEVEVPEVLVENQVESMVKDMEQRMMYQGLKLEDYLKYTNQTVEAYKEGFKDQAKEQVKTQLVINHIIVEEKIEATKELVEEKVAEFAKNSNKEVEEFKKTLDERAYSYLENQVVIEKLFEFIKENNTIA